MELLDGKKVRSELLEELKEDIEGIDRPLGLTVIQVGEDPGSTVYVGQKKKLAESLGYNFNHIDLDENIEEKELISIIDKLNEDDKVDGIIVQMPIPKHLDSKKIQNRVLPEKDVDGLTDINMGRLVHNVDSGIIEILNKYNIEIKGKNVVIVGRSDLVGKPLANLFLNNDATVTVCHSKTNNLIDICKTADILVAAIGKSKFITSDYIKEDAVVIDVGINRGEDGKLSGDVDFEDVKDEVSYITPVPGGVGPMTVAELMKNTYKAHMIKNKK